MPCGSSFATPCGTPGNFSVGHQSSPEWHRDFGTGCQYGVPQGCVIRNTFIEWREYQTPSKNADGQSTPVYENESDRDTPARRARSSPPSPMASSSVSTQVEETETQASQSGGSADGHEVTAAYSQEARRSSYGRSRGERHAREEESSSWNVVSPKGRGAVYQAPSPNSPPAHSDATLLLRGLPFTATEEEVLAFVKQCGVSENLLAPRPIVIITNSANRPSGFAEVRLAINELPDADARLAEAREALHLRCLGDRYIEVLPPRSKDSAWPTSASPAWRSSHGHSGGRGGASRGSPSHGENRRKQWGGAHWGSNNRR